ncbi:MAG: PilT/PilU family type 4a pilus ATPase [Halothiobacillaceae bacterium]
MADYSNLEPFLKLLAEKEGSDLYFSTGTMPAVKIQGELRFIGREPLEPGQTRTLAASMLSEEQMAHFDKTLELNAALQLPGVGRYRLNAFMQRGELAMVIRFIQTEIPGIEQLNLPKILHQLILEKRGLIIVVGATGSGKSTTLAAMIDYRARQIPGHILTIEDPIEFAFQHRNSVVNQREVGVDTHNYTAALKEAMREAPDVIMIGEVRDRANMEHALAYADTGHLCLTTLHATNAHQALDRIMRFFPPEGRDQLLMDLSLNLKAVISQRLIISADGRRMPAVEVLINSPFISELIRRGNVDQINDAMEKSAQGGMQTFDMSLFQLWKDEKITREEALANADSRANLEWRMNFGSSMKGSNPDAESSNPRPHQNADGELPPLG